MFKAFKRTLEYNDNMVHRLPYGSSTKPYPITSADRQRLYKSVQKRIQDGISFRQHLVDIRANESELLRNRKLHVCDVQSSDADVNTKTRFRYEEGKVNRHLTKHMRELQLKMEEDQAEIVKLQSLLLENEVIFRDRLLRCQHLRNQLLETLDEGKSTLSLSAVDRSFSASDHRAIKMCLKLSEFQQMRLAGYFGTNEIRIHFDNLDKKPEEEF